MFNVFITGMGKNITFNFLTGQQPSMQCVKFFYLYVKDPQWSLARA